MSWSLLLSCLLHSLITYNANIARGTIIVKRVTGKEIRKEENSCGGAVCQGSLEGMSDTPQIGSITCPKCGHVYAGRLLLQVSQIAANIGCRPQTVFKWISNDLLPARLWRIRYNRVRRMVDAYDFDRFLDSFMPYKGANPDSPAQRTAEYLSASAANANHARYAKNHAKKTQIQEQNPSQVNQSDKS